MVCYFDEGYFVVVVGVGDVLYFLEGEVVVVNGYVVVCLYLYVMFYVVILVEGDVGNCYC